MLAVAAQQPPVFVNLIIYAVVAAFIVYRYSRPMKMSLTRLFVAPILFVALTVFVIWSSQQTHPASALEITAAVAIGIVLGVPLGLAMTAHRTVRRTEQPHVMYVDPSWITAAIWVAAFMLRAVIHILLPLSALGTMVGDGLLLFAISAVVTSYWVLYRKFRALDEAPQAA
jgi:ABC-type proline/glycine betaine transport system permease subunit